MENLKPGQQVMATVQGRENVGCTVVEAPEDGKVKVLVPDGGDGFECLVRCSSVKTPEAPPKVKAPKAAAPKPKAPKAAPEPKPKTAKAAKPKKK